MHYEWDTWFETKRMETQHHSVTRQLNHPASTARRNIVEGFGCSASIRLLSEASESIHVASILEIKLQRCSFHCANGWV